jgi:FkbM family methyltransferase
VIVHTAGLRIGLRDPGTEGSLGDRAAFAHVFFAGEYDFLLSRISRGDIVLDAGANIGCFSLQASRRAGPQGLVIAVEPEQSNAACLRANIELNNSRNIFVAERALDAIGERMVEVVGTGTTARVDDDRAVVPIVDPTAGRTRTSVRAITLDKLLEELSLDRFDLVKMDIEGAENAIFVEAATSAVLRNARAVAVEVHDREGAELVRDRLMSDGYSYVSEVKTESQFLVDSIRRGILRLDLMLRLYGMEVTSVAARVIADAVANKPPATAQVLGMVYASR